MALLGVTHDDSLSREAREVLAGVWMYRARAEQQAAERFDRLARELREIGALAECIALAERGRDDELRHVQICTALAADYGARYVAERVEPAAPIGPRSLSLRERVLYELVAFCCVTETLNASLMKVALDRARVPEVKRALREILRDEVRHAKLGWAHLAWECSEGGADLVARALPNMLAGAVQEELFDPKARAVDGEALERHGELSEADRLAIFEATAAHVLLPGFELHGIDTGPMRAWLFR